MVSSGGSFGGPQGIGLEVDGDILGVDPAALGGPAVIRVDPLTGAQVVVSSDGSLVIPRGVAVIPANASGAFTAFLHGSDGTATPPTFFLDASTPTTTTAKYKDLPSVKFSGGNPWKEVGAWDASPAFSHGLLTTLRGYPETLLGKKVDFFDS